MWEAKPLGFITNSLNPVFLGCKCVGTIPTYMYSVWNTCICSNSVVFSVDPTSGRDGASPVVNLNEALQGLQASAHTFTVHVITLYI